MRKNEGGDSGFLPRDIFLGEGDDHPRWRTELRPSAGERGDVRAGHGRGRCWIRNSYHSERRTVDHPGARELILKFVLNYWLHLNTLKDYVGGASIN